MIDDLKGKKVFEVPPIAMGHFFEESLLEFLLVTDEVVEKLMNYQGKFLVAISLHQILLLVTSLYEVVFGFFLMNRIIASFLFLMNIAFLLCSPEPFLVKVSAVCLGSVFMC